MLLTIRQAAEQLACSPKQVRRLIDSGAIKTVRLGTSAKSDRIHPVDLDSFINEGRACRSESAAKHGKYMSPVEVSELDALLGGQGQTRSASKPRSAAA